MTHLEDYLASRCKTWSRPSQGCSPWDCISWPIARPVYPRHNDENFKSNVTILKSNLILPKPNTNLIDGFLCLEDTDYTPVELWWGFCILGFFARKFPGKRWCRNLFLGGLAQVVYHIILMGA